MDISLSADAIVLYEKSLNYATSLNDKYLRTSHFLYIVLTEDKFLQNILINLDIDIDNLIKDVKLIVEKNIIVNKNNSPIVLNDDFIELLSYSASDIWYTYEIFNHIMLVNNECLTLLYKYNINQKKVNNAYFTYKSTENKNSNKNKEQPQSQYLTNLNNIATPCFERDEILKNIFRVLNRTKKKNVILVGEAGVGKTQIVEGLAYLLNKNEAPINLLDYTVMSLNMFDLLNENNFKGDLEFKLNNIIKNISGKKIILFIDEIHLLSEKYYNVFNLLKPFLSSDLVSIIGCTTNQEYSENIEKFKSITRRFQTINVLELNEKAVFKIIKNINKNNIDDETIINIIEYTKKIKNSQNPDKSLELVDDIYAFYKSENYANEKYNHNINQLAVIQKNKKKIINNGNYQDAIPLKNAEISLNENLKNFNNNININIDNILLDDYLIRNNLKIKNIDYKNVINNIKNEIFGQDKAFKKIENSLFVNEIFEEKNKSFLLIGNTGVGKTQFVKLFAKEIDYKLVRIDGGDYGDKFSVSNLIGSPFGYVDSDTEPSWLTTIKTYGKVVLLFDEFEKSHIEIQNIFLRILDEKEYQYKTNNIIDFSDVYIFFTSNAGIRDSNIGFGDSTFNPNLKTFKNEFLNRISTVVTFENLDIDNIFKIAKKELNQLAENTLLKDIIPLIDLDSLIHNIDFNNTGIRGLKLEIKKTIIELLNN